jgi:hypothetical protein
MRGDDQQQSGMFSYVSLEERVLQDHPLRRIREMVDGILRAMAKDFDGLYAKQGVLQCLQSGCCGRSSADFLFGA